MAKVRVQKQLHRHCPEQGVWGDCYRTAIACLLDVPASMVPHVYDHGATSETALPEMDAWLDRNGLTRITIAYQGELEGVVAALETLNPGKPFLLSGTSPRGFGHCVVYQGGEMVCDPAHEGGGLVGPQSDGNFWVEYIVRRLDASPHRLRPCSLKTAMAAVMGVADKTFSPGMDWTDAEIIANAVLAAFSEEAR